MRPTLLISLVLLLPTVLNGQEQGLRAFSEVIDVRVLNLEVAVTGKDGRHVPDLGSEDFRLFIDGEQVPIEYFSEIRQGAARAPTGHEMVSAVPSVTPGQVVGTSFLLFVDNFFGIARDRKVVLHEILEMLPDLGPEDRMAVVSFDGRQLDLVGDWSSSPETIAGTLRAAMDQRAFGLQRMAESSVFEGQLRSLGAGLIQESTENTAVEYIRKLSQQVSSVVKAATTAMRTMSSVPGRKVLLLTAGGWPDDPSAYAVGQDANIRYRTLGLSPKQAFEDLQSTANLLGYTVYPIDLPGKQSHGSGAAEGGSRYREIAPGQFDTSVEAFDRTLGRESEVELPLLALAKETGGRAMINGLRQSVLPRALEDTGSYYWLGYAPQRERDDEHHEIRVEVLRPGLESRSRRGFRDLSRQAEVTMMVESNLLFSTPLSDHTLEIEIGKPKRAGRGRLALPVSLKIPLDQVVMLPVARGFEARLELRVAAMDAKGARSEIPVIPVTLGGRARPASGAYAIYDTSLMLRRHRQRVALALYDLAGEQILSTAIEFDPASI